MKQTGGNIINKIESTREFLARGGEITHIEDEVKMYRKDNLKKRRKTKYNKLLLLALNPIYFYISQEWLETNKEFLQSRKYTCEICGRSHKINKVWINSIHKKSIRGYPALAFEKSNLVAVCDICKQDENIYDGQKNAIRDVLNLQGSLA